MSSFVFSDLRVLGQIGTTIGLGLLFDTLVVRVIMTPSIAVLLGRWFCGRNERACAPPAGCFGRTARGPWSVNCCCARATMTRELRWPPTVKVVIFRGICRARSTGRASKPTRI